MCVRRRAENNFTRISKVYRLRAEHLIKLKLCGHQTTRSKKAEGVAGLQTDARLHFVLPWPHRPDSSVGNLQQNSDADVGAIFAHGFFAAGARGVSPEFRRVV